MNEPTTHDRAAEAAISLYARRTGDLFDLEDLYRSVHDREKADEAHHLAVLVGHAAYLEDKNPTPYGLDD